MDFKKYFKSSFEPEDVLEQWPKYVWSLHQQQRTCWEVGNLLEMQISTKLEILGVGTSNLF